jgi:hypothetical protein
MMGGRSRREPERAELLPMTHEGDRPMSKKIVTMLLLSALVLLGACAKKYKPGELAAGIQSGDTYYTQFSLFQEKNAYRTSNYRRGGLIPINTPVTLDSIDSKHIELTLKPSGQKLSIENVQKHTNEDIQQAFKKILGKRKVDLSQFSNEEQQNILGGQVKKGMSRQAVKAALGYPPQNSTPSLESNDWIYWSSRYDRFIVRFKNDRVDAIIN